jgi:Ca2+-binding RTX toxin-like protein
VARTLVAALFACAFGIALLAPGSASATVTCAQAMDVVTVNITAGGNTQASLDVSGGAIRVHDGALGAADLCPPATPTVTNTDTINVNDTSGGDSVLLVSLQGGTFAPGENIAPPTPDATGPEIEINYTAGAGIDRVEVEGSDNADTFDLAQAAPGGFNANLNPAADGATPDCDDVAATGVENVIARGRGGDDDINASGCGGLPALDPDTLSLEGNNQEDMLRGGPGGDSIKGGTQADNLSGGAGDDSLDGERDNDKLDGGAAADLIVGGSETDRVLYEDRTMPVTATIGNGAADDGDTGDQSGGARDNIDATVENITGGTVGDSLTGSFAINDMEGGAGDDVMNGLGANDTVDGGIGNDTQDGGDGADKVRGESGADIERGGSGKDKVLGGDSADLLFGGPGGDLLRGEKGKDLFKGQLGNDKLAARDGKRDKKIDCGAGKARKESATLDRKDPKPKSC